MLDRVQSVLKNFEKVDAAKVSPTAHFSNDLGLDSLDAVELVVLLQRNFGLEVKNMDQGKEIFSSINTIAQYVYDNKPA